MFGELEDDEDEDEWDDQLEQEEDEDQQSDEENQVDGNQVQDQELSNSEDSDSNKRSSPKKSSLKTSTTSKKSSKSLRFASKSPSPSHSRPTQTSTQQTLDSQYQSDSILLKSLREKAKSDSQKAREIAAQTKGFERTLEGRIRVQGLVRGLNKIQVMKIEKGKGKEEEEQLVSLLVEEGLELEDWKAERLGLILLASSFFAIFDLLHLMLLITD